MDIKQHIRDVPNFPKEGIIYKDITPLLKDHQAFAFVVNEISKNIPQDVTTIVAPESRGFIFASAISYNLKKNLVLVRKKGKLPYKTFEIDYELEYGTDSFEIHTDSIEPGDKIAIVDDLLATGGTVEAIEKLVRNFNCTISSISFVIELKSLQGRDKLRCDNISSLINY
jgi:adenine phosphoribosyltransferase